MIIYIYQGMMALGRGGSMMGKLRRQMQEGEVGVRRNYLGVKQMLKGWHQQILTNISHFKEVLMIGGCQDPISSFVSLPHSFHHHAF